VKQNEALTHPLLEPVRKIKSNNLLIATVEEEKDENLWKTSSVSSPGLSSTLSR